MRSTLCAVFVLWLGCPHAALGQSLELHGTAGATFVDAGYTLAAGLGITPTSRLTILLDVERTDLSTRLPDNGRGGAVGFRGGTFTVGTAQLRVSLFRRNRIGPYGIVGFATGVSRPTVNDLFPTPVTNSVRAMTFGGGIQVPLTRTISVVGDVRMMVGTEAGELLAVVPIRAGVAWHF